MESADKEKKELIQLLKQLDDKPSDTKLKLSSQQAERLARVIKKLLKQQLH